MSLLATFSEYFESGARKILPYGLMVLLLVLNSVHMPLIAGGNIKAPLFLMALYYWSIYRPTLIPPSIAFFSGMAVDLLGGLPLGLNAVIFVLVQWIVSDQRRFLMGQSFIMIWFGFFVLCVFAGFLEWFLFGLVSLNWPNIRPLFFTVLMGVALFPVVCVILHWTHKILPSPARRSSLNAP